MFMLHFIAALGLAVAIVICVFLYVQERKDGRQAWAIFWLLLAVWDAFWLWNAVLG